MEDAVIIPRRIYDNLIDNANHRIEDIQSGIDEGMYEDDENNAATLADLREAIAYKPGGSHTFPDPDNPFSPNYKGKTMPIEPTNYPPLPPRDPVVTPGMFFLFRKGKYLGEYKTSDEAVISAYTIRGNENALWVMKNSGEDYLEWFSKDEHMDSKGWEIVHEANYRHLHGDIHPKDQ